MKRISLFSAILIIVMRCYPTFAGTPTTEITTINNFSYKSADDEVGLEIERVTGEVLLHLSVKDYDKYDYIIIERSNETAKNFGKCKYIASNNIKANEGYVLQVDKFAYTPAKDVYYRIKTTTKDGVERSYPPILLPASSK